MSFFFYLFRRVIERKIHVHSTAHFEFSLFVYVVAISTRLSQFNSAISDRWGLKKIFRSRAATRHVPGTLYCEIDFVYLSFELEFDCPVLVSKCRHRSSGESPFWPRFLNSISQVIVRKQIFVEIRFTSICKNHQFKYSLISFIDLNHHSICTDILLVVRILSLHANVEDVKFDQMVRRSVRGW